MPVFCTHFWKFPTKNRHIYKKTGYKKDTEGVHKNLLCLFIMPLFEITIKKGKSLIIKSRKGNPLVQRWLSSFFFSKKFSGNYIFKVFKSCFKFLN